MGQTIAVRRDFTSEEVRQPAFGDRGGAQWRIAARRGEGRWHGPPDATGLGDPVRQRTVAYRFPLSMTTRHRL
jgi:hypothetical protein